MVDSGDTDEEELTSVGKWEKRGGMKKGRGRYAVRMLVPLHLLPEPFLLFPILPRAWEADLCRPPRQGSLAAAFWYCLANGRNKQKPISKMNDDPKKG